MTILTILGRIG